MSSKLWFRKVGGPISYKPISPEGYLLTTLQTFTIGYILFSAPTNFLHLNTTIIGFLIPLTTANTFFLYIVHLKGSK